jgi:group I intron endonuclease
VSVISYNNLLTNKALILADNLGKAGIYQFIHLKSGKISIGSAVDLSKRLSLYFSPKFLERFKSAPLGMYIYNAILDHGLEAFSLAIIEYIDISNLSKEDVKKLILLREQYFLDCIFSVDEPNTYNILKKAGSRLGSSHSEQARQ